MLGSLVLALFKSGTKLKVRSWAMFPLRGESDYIDRIKAKAGELGR